METNAETEALIFNFLEANVCPIDFMETMAKLETNDAWILKFAIWSMIPDGELELSQWKLLESLSDADFRKYCNEFALDLSADKALNEIKNKH